MTQPQPQFDSTRPGPKLVSTKRQVGGNIKVTPAQVEQIVAIANELHGSESGTELSRLIAKRTGLSEAAIDAVLNHQRICFERAYRALRVFMGTADARAQKVLAQSLGEFDPAA